MKVLSLSDTIIPFIYSPQIRRRFTGIDFVLGCGDLAYTYLEYVLNALDVPLYFVRGNHDEVVEYSRVGLIAGEQDRQRTMPRGGIDIHRRLIRHSGILLAGVEGSMRYRPGKFQYSQAEMWSHVYSLVPGLLMNRLRYGRYLDIFLTHAPPAGIHDAPDLPHQGIRAFRWLISTFQPSYHLHGHVHIYRPDAVAETRVGKTRVINTYGYRETEIVLER